jgi:hypothetical protein
MSSIDMKVLFRRKDGKVLYKNIDINEHIIYTDYFISEDLEIIDPEIVYINKLDHTVYKLHNNSIVLEWKKNNTEWEWYLSNLASINQPDIILIDVYIKTIQNNSLIKEIKSILDKSSISKLNQDNIISFIDNLINDDYST